MLAPIWGSRSIGPPEGEAAKAIIAARDGKAPGADVLYPTIDDGVKGVAFVEACVRSSDANAAWVSL